MGLAWGDTYASLRVNMYKEADIYLFLVSCVLYTNNLPQQATWPRKMANDLDSQSFAGTFNRYSEAMIL